MLCKLPHHKITLSADYSTLKSLKEDMFYHYLYTYSALLKHFTLVLNTLILEMNKTLYSSKFGKSLEQHTAGVEAVICIKQTLLTTLSDPKLCAASNDF